MKTNLGTGYTIKGFDNDLSLNEWYKSLGLERTNITVLYQGKTSEIPEEIAEVCVIHRNFYEFKDYSNVLMAYKTAKESIQSACNQTYCIIYKEK